MTDPMADLERQLKPYRDQFPSFRELPAQGLARAEVTGLVEQLASAEERTWREGYASGAVYHGDPEHVAFLSRIYTAQSQSNPLHPDLWPSATKFEAEIVAMTASMLGAGHAPPGTPVVGTVSSGGTESILLAMKAYRDFARERRGIAAPEIVAPVTAHAAFDKAARFFDMPLVRVPVDDEFRADLGALAAAVTERTAVVVGSAPTFPHGVIDPIPEIAALAAERGVGCHVDACLGGFILPWARAAGLPGTALRLPAARGDLDVGRHAQVRLRGQGLVGRAVPGPGTAPVPVLHADRLAGRAVPVPHLRRQPARRPVRYVLGGHGLDRGSAATSRRPGGSCRPGRGSGTASPPYPACACSATRCG